jgi:Family of unknown function (DUF6178)
MAPSLPLLDRLLKTPDLAKAVPHLQPEVLHRIIQICGLEDAAEFVALATPDQLARVLDIDIWRVRTAGVDEEFDADRFALWLDVLMQSGAVVAVEKLMGLDVDVVVAGFSGHVTVFDQAAVSSYATLDGEQMPGRVSSSALTAEIGGYVIEAGPTSVWDTIVDLLAHLDSHHSEYFNSLMRGCVRLSNGRGEPDGFHTLLDDREQDLFDLACDREGRRQQLGYVTPAQARAFMQAARDAQLDSDRPPHSPLARAYFRDLEATAGAPEEVRTRSAGLLTESRQDATPPIEAAVIAEVVEVLRDAGVLPEEPRGLLQSAAGDRSRPTLIQDFFALHASSTRDLAYLGNVMIAGCSIQGRAFTRREASDAVVAVCNLGLENWPSRWKDCDLLAAFQVGWTVLHRNVCLYAANRLIDVAADLRCNDRDIQMRMHGLRRELMRHLADAAPWRARQALEVLIMLDATSWAALLALTDECPVIHAAMDTSRRCLAIDPADYQFIAHTSQIALVREFMDSLSARLIR